MSKFISDDSSVGTESSEATSEASTTLGIVFTQSQDGGCSRFGEGAVEDLLGDEFEQEVQRNNEGLFSYQSGWPQLNQKLLKRARCSIHKRLRGLRQARKFALEKVSRLCNE
jgi:hypothetical protein